MRVGILTWYKALNHGAALQAYASCKLLEEMGASPIMLDYKWNIEIDGTKYSRLFRYVKKFSFSQVRLHQINKKWKREKKIVFDRFVNEMLPVGKDYSIEENLDAVYIGSDMVFDICQGYNAFMYGMGVHSNYIFSYAASFGYTTGEMLNESNHRNDIVEALNRLKAIGYRDRNTYEILAQNGVSTPNFECIDPVLCYGFNKELDLWDTGKWKDKRYILVYAYDSTMNESSTILQLKKIANKENLIIVSCGYYHRWCDECVQASPQEFVEMVKHAYYVVTDTFHGTVFATIMHKRIAVIVRKNGFKLKYYLEQAGLLNCISVLGNGMEQILHQDIDYSAFNEWLLNQKTRSEEFIRQNLDKAMVLSKNVNNTPL